MPFRYSQRVIKQPTTQPATQPNALTRNADENPDGPELPCQVGRHRAEDWLLAGGTRGALLRLQGCRCHGDAGLASGRPATMDPKSDEPAAQTEATHRFKADAAANEQLAHTRKLSDASAKANDAVFFPDGHGPLWDLAEDALKERGGVYSKGADWQPHVVIDGLLVTGQNPASSAPAARALLKLLARH